jgi:DNA (cytosine-5)-methyltransferase 1
MDAPQSQSGRGDLSLHPVDLLPTPRTRDGKGATASRSGDNKHDLPSALADPTILLGGGSPLLPTPTCQDGKNTAGPSQHERNSPPLNVEATLLSTQWGKYEPAIRRWEAALGRVAPSPTEVNKNGNVRLSAEFSSWLMGWPDGWVTDPAIGISRNEQLKIIGNGVVPQQAEAAIRYLLTVSEAA